MNRRPLASYNEARGDFLEGDYEVYFGNQLAGKTQVIKSGLYYRIVCRCRVTGAVMCRLSVLSEDTSVDLGILVPTDGGFGLDTRIAQKKLGKGKLNFRIIVKNENARHKFMPITPEEPFSYLSRLKEGFLERQGSQLGIMLKAGTE